MVRKVFQMLHLVRFALLLKCLDGLFLRNLFPDKGKVLFDDFQNPLLYLFQILRGEGSVVIKVVIKSGIC